MGVSPGQHVQRHLQTLVGTLQIWTSLLGSREKWLLLGLWSSPVGWGVSVDDVLIYISTRAGS